MDDLVGFHVGFWDYVTFAGLFFITATFLTALVTILGLPGRIAIARHHPEADAVNLMGWIGFLAVVPWIRAFIWAFKPTDVVDIRYMPEERQRHTDEMLERLTGKEGSPPVQSKERQHQTDETIAQFTRQKDASPTPASRSPSP
jgi:uncharacterized protein DUF3302